MGSTIAIGLNGERCVIPAPQYGYETKITLPFHWQRRIPTGYSANDDGTAYDVRMCEAEWMLNEVDVALFTQFYTRVGRGADVNLWLHKNSGFTPFGPDRGDYGNYQVTISDVSIRGPQSAPYKYFTLACTLTAHTFPTVTAPTTQYDGLFQIGSAVGLRFPDDFPQAEQSYAIEQIFTRDGTAYARDRLPGSDNYETVLKMVCSRSRAYALLTYLVSTVRTNNLTIETLAGTYMFGSENGSGGTYVCQWVDSEILVKHSGFNRYEFELRFSLVSRE